MTISNRAASSSRPIRSISRSAISATARLFAPMADVADLIRRVAPYVAGRPAPLRPAARRRSSATANSRKSACNASDPLPLLRGRAAGARIPQRRRGAYRALGQHRRRARDEDFENSSSSARIPRGIIFERWRHIHGCARFFNAVRDTVTDKFLMTYKAGEPKPIRRERLRGQSPPTSRHEPADAAEIGMMTAPTASPAPAA